MSKNQKSNHWEINELHFRDEVPQFLSNRTKERKFNLKIKKLDLLLIDKLAEHYSVPRSVIVNELLYRALVQELRDIRTLDVEVLLANYADSKITHNRQNWPWIFDVLGSDINKIRDQYQKGKDMKGNPLYPTKSGHSAHYEQTFEFLKKKIK